MIVKLCADDQNGNPGTRHPESKDFWHPLLHVQPLESTNVPRSVVPVPRPIYRHSKRGEDGIEPKDYVYEHVAYLQRVDSVRARILLLSVGTMERCAGCHSTQCILGTC